jgi:hypothetical protein
LPVPVRRSFGDIFGVATADETNRDGIDQRQINNKSITDTKSLQRKYLEAL